MKKVAIFEKPFHPFISLWMKLCNGLRKRSSISGCHLNRTNYEAICVSLLSHWGTGFISGLLSGPWLNSEALEPPVPANNIKLNREDTIPKTEVQFCLLTSPRLYPAFRIWDSVCFHLFLFCKLLLYTWTLVCHQQTLSAYLNFWSCSFQTALASCYPYLGVTLDL